MPTFSLSLRDLCTDLYHNGPLLWALVKREIVARYRGSMMGLLWSFINPVLMLMVYTFVFSVIFKARWSGGSDSKTEFALVLFTGLIVFNLFAECLNRAPTVIISQVNYVKKVVFPLHILPIVQLGASLFHCLVSLLVWLVFYLFFFGIPSITALLLPIALLPIMLITLGMSWLLASLGVYLRDTVQVVGVLTTALLFLSPIFYPIEILPDSYQTIIHINPLTLAVSQVRDILVWGQPLDWWSYLTYLSIALLVAWIGFAWFQKTRRGFADVL